MSRLTKFVVVSCLFVLLSSGKFAKHSLWLVVNNTSSDGKAVDMKFSFVSADQNKEVVEVPQVSLGLNLFPEKKLKTGPYQVVINTDNDQVVSSQNFTVDADRWVLVNYIREDSANVIKNYGYIDPARFTKVGNQYVAIYISIESRKPAGL